jgi:hypothetical protein
MKLLSLVCYLTLFPHLLDVENNQIEDSTQRSIFRITLSLNEVTLRLNNEGTEIAEVSICKSEAVLNKTENGLIQLKGTKVIVAS